MASSQSLQTVAVIGAGDVGNGLARLSALAGLHVRLYDRSPDALRRAVDHIRQAVEQAVEGGRLSAADRQGILDGMVATADFGEAVSGADLVVDASPDLLRLKSQIFAEIAALGVEATLATTSALPLAEVAGASPRPEGVVGLRFAEPLDENDRLEIVVLEATDPRAVDRAYAFAARIARRAAVVRGNWGQ